jgi:hypothetical protein
MSHEFLYEDNAHVRYTVITPRDHVFVVEGRVIEHLNPSHYRIKRDKLLTTNVGMYELDVVNERDICGRV